MNTAEKIETPLEMLRRQLDETVSELIDLEQAMTEHARNQARLAKMDSTDMAAFHDLDARVRAFNQGKTVQRLKDLHAAKGDLRRRIETAKKHVYLAQLETDGAVLIARMREDAIKLLSLRVAAGMSHNVFDWWSMFDEQRARKQALELLEEI
jgi:uncharacterized protein YhaN